MAASSEHKLESTMAAECLSGRIRKLGRVVNSIFDRQFRPHGVRSSQISILIVVGLHGPTTATEVCGRLCLEKSTLSRDLERLIDNGWIRATEAGGRRRNLELTTEGRALLRRIQPAWKIAQTEVEKLLGPALSAELCRVVDSTFSLDDTD